MPADEPPLAKDRMVAAPVRAPDSSGDPRECAAIRRARNTLKRSNAPCAARARSRRWATGSMALAGWRVPALARVRALADLPSPPVINSAGSTQRPAAVRPLSSLAGSHRGDAGHAARLEHASYACPPFARGDETDVRHTCFQHDLERLLVVVSLGRDHRGGLAGSLARDCSQVLERHDLDSERR